MGLILGWGSVQIFQSTVNGLHMIVYIFIEAFQISVQYNNYVQYTNSVCFHRDQSRPEQLELLSLIVSVNFHYMFTKCSLYTHYMFTICSLNVHYILTICSLYVHYMFTICVNKDQSRPEQLELLLTLNFVNFQVVSVLQSIEVQHQSSCNLQSLM